MTEGIWVESLEMGQALPPLPSPCTLPDSSSQCPATSLCHLSHKEYWLELFPIVVTHDYSKKSFIKNTLFLPGVGRLERGTEQATVTPMDSSSASGLTV